MIAEIHVKVSFTKHTTVKKDLGVVQGDYNTTKLVFDFEEDVSGHEIVFQMSDPHGDLVMLKSLVNNEVVLVGYTEDGQACTLFNEEGLYPFELVLYQTDGKLTSAPAWLTVNKQLVEVDNETVETYIPFFDDLMGEVGELANAGESFSNAIKINKSGTSITANDVSPIEHELKVKVKRNPKNELPYPFDDENYWSFNNGPTRVINGITFTDNGDGTVTADGTATAQAQVLLHLTVGPYTGWYTVSGCPQGVDESRIMVGVKQADGTTAVGTWVATADTPLSKELNNNTLYFYVRINAGATVNNVVFKPQLEKGRQATEFVPYFDVSKVSVSVAESSQTVTANEDGTVEGLKSVSPNMTLVSDTNGAIIDCTYNADTKMYIDNKFAELAAAMLNS